jgi:UDP:flavonoid glycosyltransferase YjiC (YdhE family)
LQLYISFHHFDLARIVLAAFGSYGDLHPYLAVAIGLRDAPYSKLFPRALVNVHQGGIGTIAQALRAGKPMLVVPYSHDQPDNAARVERLGVARVLTRRNYRQQAIVETLRDLVKDASAWQRTFRRKTP